jgi:hypothetical protein
VALYYAVTHLPSPLNTSLCCQNDPGARDDP